MNARRNSLSHGIDMDGGGTSAGARAPSFLQSQSQAAPSMLHMAKPSSALEASHRSNLALMMSGFFSPQQQSPSSAEQPPSSAERGDAFFRPASPKLLQMLQRPSSKAVSVDIPSAKKMAPSPPIQKPAATTFSMSLSLLLSAQPQLQPLSSSAQPNTPPQERTEVESPSPTPRAESPSSATKPDQQRFKPFHEEKWSRRLDELRHFRTEHGHCLVPHVHPPNPQLACWVKRQRRQYKLLREGKTSTMSAERVMVLEEIGFVWDSHDATWAERVEELREYRTRHGNCLVPSTSKTYPQLAVWVKCQRRQYKLWREGRTSSMTQGRFWQLEGMGFCWEARTSLHAPAV